MVKVSQQKKRVVNKKYIKKKSFQFSFEFKSFSGRRGKRRQTKKNQS